MYLSKCIFFSHHKLNEKNGKKIENNKKNWRKQHFKRKQNWDSFNSKVKSYRKLEKSLTEPMLINKSNIDRPRKKKKPTKIWVARPSKSTLIFRNCLSTFLFHHTLITNRHSSFNLSHDFSMWATSTNLNCPIPTNKIEYKNDVHGFLKLVQCVQCLDTFHFTVKQFFRVFLCLENLT